MRAASVAMATISVQPDWKVSWQSRWARVMMPAFWLQKGHVPVADFRRLERGMKQVSGWLSVGVFFDPEQTIL